MPNWRLTLILTGVFAALALYSFFFEMKRPAPLPDDDKSVAVWTMSDRQKKDFKRLEIADGLQRATFTKDDKDAWWEEAPQRQKLDATRLDYTLNNVREVRADRVVEDNPARLADYGLDKPIFHLTLADQDKKPLYELVGGGQSPTKSGYYVQKVGDPKVYLVATWRLDDVKHLVTTPAYPHADAQTHPDPATDPYSHADSQAIVRRGNDFIANHICHRRPCLGATCIAKTLGGLRIARAGGSETRPYPFNNS